MTQPPEPDALPLWAYPGLRPITAQDFLLDAFSQAEWPAHLRDDAPSATCSVCGRKTWDPTAFGFPCRMPQPNGGPCTGTFSDPASPTGH